MPDLDEHPCGGRTSRMTRLEADTANEEKVEEEVVVVVHVRSVSESV